MKKAHTLEEILIQASTHPYYIDLLPTPPPQQPTLSTFPLLTKPHLFTILTHLLTPPHPPSPSTRYHALLPQPFLQSIYISPTGGTRSPNTHLYNITSLPENRRVRKSCSRLANVLSVITKNDILANLHCTLPMYQSQQLTGDLIEYAGATQLNLTMYVKEEMLREVWGKFNPNGLFALPSRVVGLARWVREQERLEKVQEAAEGPKTSTTSSSTPNLVRIRPRKFLFSSEPLSRDHEVFIGEALGITEVGSLYGSAELGPCAVAPLQPILTGADLDPSTTTRPDLGYRDFVVDRKMLIVEVLDEGGSGTILASSVDPVMEEVMEEGMKGELVFTSMLKFTHPIVRYRTGDYGSIHPYTGPLDLSVKGAGSREDYFVIRLYGRLPEKSFNVDGEYIDLHEITNRVFSKPEYDILEWQVILDQQPCDDVKGLKAGDTAEFRVVTRGGDVSEDYEERLQKHLVDKVFGPGLQITVRRVEHSELERGARAAKMLKIVDRRVKKE